MEVFVESLVVSVRIAFRKYILLVGGSTRNLSTFVNVYRCYIVATMLVTHDSVVNSVDVDLQRPVISTLY